MANDWIIDVLADLKTYATKNGLGALSHQLDKSSLIATSEIAASAEKALETTKIEVGKTGRVYRAFADRENA